MTYCVDLKIVVLNLNSESFGLKTLEINHVYKFEHCDVECCDRLVQTLRAVQTGGLALNCDIVLAGVCLLHRDRRICNRVYRFGEQLPFTWELYF